jgi:hypothetical protein
MKFKFLILIFILSTQTQLQAQSMDKIMLRTNKLNYVPGDSIIFNAIIPKIKNENNFDKKLKLEVLNEKDSILTSKYFEITNGIANGLLIIDTTIMETIYALNIKIVTDQNIDVLFNNASLTLKTVLVKNVLKRSTKQINEEYTTGMFKNSATARILDLINEPPPNTGNGIPILQYIQGKLPGLMVSVGAGGKVVLTSLRRISISAASPIIVYLDEQEAGDIISQIYPRDVSLVKYWPPGTAQIPGSGGAGVLAIYSKKWSDNK